MDYKQLIMSLISTFGYAGLAVGMLMEFTGLPFPGELVLGFAGFMVWRGVFLPGITLAIVLGFSWAGTLAAYFIGRILGRPFLFRYGNYIGLTEKRLEQVEDWFASNRVVVLLLGRFISGVRPLSAYVAGMAKMSLFSFAILSFMGTALWTSTFVLIGYLLGSNWARLSNYSLLLGLFFLALSLFVIGFFYWRRRKKRQREEEAAGEGE